MPELPEVETIKRGLEKKIIGLTITKVEVLTSKSFSEKKEIVEGKKVIGVWRRAKMLGIDLSGNLTMLIHLKMSGQLVYTYDHQRFIGGHPTLDMADQMPNKSTRVIFTFMGNSHLYFNDQRKFGWIKLVHGSQLVVYGQEILGRLGPEPLDKDFTWQVLKSQLLKHPKLAVKVALMDQTVIAGIGNIYASESLFLAKIDPRRKINNLSESDFKKLTESIKKSLEMAIRYGGSTRTHFVDAEGRKGRFLDFANVYNRAKMPCKRCSGTVNKIALGGRGTYFCPECQS